MQKGGKARRGKPCEKIWCGKKGGQSVENDRSYGKEEREESGKMMGGREGVKDMYEREGREEDMMREK